MSRRAWSACSPGTAAGLAKIAFFVFLILAVIGFFMGRRRGV